jgi:SAM-dependent methyltransferase
MFLNDKCVYCAGKLTFFRKEKIDCAYDEIGFIKKIDATEIELLHGKCIDCSSIIAADIRMTNDSNLLDAYFDAPETYSYDKKSMNRHIPFYKKVESIINPDRNKMSICDVGCNTGGFLELLEDSWTKYGVEPSSSALNAIKDGQINIFHGTLSESPFDRHSMDIISYLDVFEHLKDPNQEIQTAQQFLAPQGKLVILTGDATSLTARLAGINWSYLKQMGHVSIASKQSLINALNKAGFLKIDVLSINHPYSRSFAHYLILLLLSKILRSQSKIRLFGREYTVPLLYDHMLIIASYR